MRLMSTMKLQRTHLTLPGPLPSACLEQARAGVAPGPMFVSPPHTTQQDLLLQLQAGFHPRVDVAHMWHNMMGAVDGMFSDAIMLHLTFCEVKKPEIVYNYSF